MNAVLWLLHFAVLWYSLPLLRTWWRGEPEEHPYGTPIRTLRRKRWAVVLSACLPPIAALWLVPLAISERWRVAEREQRRRAAHDQARRRVDIEFWREQAATGDLVSAWVGMELLAMWGVALVEPAPAHRGAPPMPQALRRSVPQALPGAHEYSHGCDCRNCVKARKQAPGWLVGGPVQPPRRAAHRTMCRCGATSSAEMCTIKSVSCGRL